MPAPGSAANRRPGCVAYRVSVGGELVEKPLSTMDDFEVARAAIYAGHDRTEVVQAARRGALSVGRGVSRRRWRSRRREMVRAALVANAVPPHLWKYATWLRLGAWLVPFPWGAILAAILWTVDQLVSEEAVTWL